MSETLKLKNVNMLSKEQYDGVAEPTNEELWAVSGLGVGLPSGKYIDLTLGASGTEYTAPANGWFFVAKTSTAGQQFLGVVVNGLYGGWANCVSSQNTLNQLLPVSKDDVVKISYTAGGSVVYFRFIYAVGEE